MRIDVKDSAEFKRLLEALVDELIDAHDHFRLHRDLDAAIPDYQAEFNQSAGFWTFTLSAHRDATLLWLCKAYDLYEGKREPQPQELLGDHRSQSPFLRRAELP